MTAPEVPGNGTAKLLSSPEGTMLAYGSLLGMSLLPILGPSGVLAVPGEGEGERGSLTLYSIWALCTLLVVLVGVLL